MTKTVNDIRGNANTSATISWLRALKQCWPVAKGSLSEVSKPSTRPKGAASGNNRMFLFSYRQNGRKRCAYVPANAVELVRQALANGRELEQRLVAEGVALIAAQRKRVQGKRRVNKMPATEIAISKTRLQVGVLSELNVLNPDCRYHRDLANQTLLALRARGMAATLYTGTRRPGDLSDPITCLEFWDAVAQQKLDAAIILDVPSTDPWFHRIRELTLPAVGDTTPYHAGMDFPGMIRKGLHRLQRQGASRIAMLTWHRGLVYDAFENTLAEFGLATHPRWIGGGAFNPALPGSGWEAFREVWLALPEKPDGLLITDEMLFSGAAQAILEMGIAVPDSLRIVTHATLNAGTTPPLVTHTRMVVDPATDAQALVDLLGLRLAGGVPPASPIQIPFAIEQVTCAPCKRNSQTLQQEEALVPMAASNSIAVTNRG